jgi:SAM-dependent methyltransferase
VSTESLESKRIREAYERYARDPSELQKRDTSNPGLRYLTGEWHSRLALRLRERSLLGPEARVLDIGCGAGGLLAWLVHSGARESNCVGVDLMPERVDQAREGLPGATFICADAVDRPWGQGRFDVVVLSMVLSSVLDGQQSRRIAGHAGAAVAAGGVAVVYDTRYPSPLNRHVRAVDRREIAMLFPGFRLDAETITVIPPVARALGRLSASAAKRIYPQLARVPLLHARNLCLLSR